MTEIAGDDHGARLESPLDVSNRTIGAANRRLDLLEGRLADLLEPILDRAGVQAASSFRRSASASASVTAAAPGVTNYSTMVCLKPTVEQAALLAASGNVEPDTIHVTLCYLGEVEGDLRPVADALRPVAAAHAPLEGVVGGVGAFAPSDEGLVPVIVLPDVPGMVELRVAVTEALAAAGVDYSRLHGFQAHLTLGYYEQGTPLPDVPLLEPLSFAALLVVCGDVVEVEIPLVGPPPVTAAAGDPPGWALPGGDELVDVDALVRQLRTKTDPVRLALIQQAMTPTLRAAGLDFDVTNPFVAKVLAQSGQHVQSIAETTRLNVMRIVRASAEEGLSIPDTATAIRAGMRSASRARATMIARTELAGAVNGGSLAAVQIVAQATGEEYLKQWSTAPGAPNPRHEEYDGLDGQTVELDANFDVGGSPVEFPGDPGGDPAETINCFPSETRVSMVGLRAATERWYEGDLVRIRTAAGDDLTGTPNHPVLRADGTWVPLGEVVEGDDLIRAEIPGENGRAPDPDRPPAAIGEVYRLARVAADPERVRLAPPDFHGDGTDGEVDVVSVDGSLFADAEVASEEEIAEFGFAAAYGACACSGDREASALGNFRGRYVVGTFASSGFVRGTREGATLLCCQRLHPASVRVGSVADGESESMESADDGSATDLQLSADGENGLALLVEPTKVVKIDRYAFSGHVYNLDTGSGWYTAESLLCRNCRCALLYVEKKAV